MSVENLDPLDEDGFPKKTKALVNRCASRLNRKWEVIIDADSLSLAPTVTETEEKVTIIIPRGALSSATQVFPFQLLRAPGGNIRVRYGTVNGITPDGMSFGDVPPFIINPVGTSGVVYLVVVTLGAPSYIIDSLSIDAAETIPADTIDTFFFQIGSYNVDGDTLSLANSVSGSQSFAWCDAPKFALS